MDRYNNLLAAACAAKAKLKSSQICHPNAVPILIEEALAILEAALPLLPPDGKAIELTDGEKLHALGTGYGSL